MNRSAALLMPNPALAAILSQGLAAEGFRTGVFDAAAMVEVLRLAAIDAVILDADSDGADAAAWVLRSDARSANPGVVLVALSRDAAAARTALLAAGVDIVLEKPASAAAIAAEITRVTRLRRLQVAGSDVAPAIERRDNVVPLFGR